MWNFDDDYADIAYSSRGLTRRHHRVYDIHLRDADIYFSDSNTQMHIVWKDNRVSDGEVSLNLNIEASSVYETRCVSLYYFEVMWHTSTGMFANAHLGSSSLENVFDIVPELGYPSALPDSLCRFQYGLLDKKYSVLYNGAVLGKCLLFRFGVVALLLNDDMSLNSVVLLSELKGDRVKIKQFIYTLNSSIIKRLVFSGGF